MDEMYDIIILGTGMKECVLAGLLTKYDGKKVLQIDKNSYYGGESASFNLTNLFKIFRNVTAPTNYGENRDWNVDLIPKVIMASGKLVKILLKSAVSQYMEYKCLDQKFIYQVNSESKGIIHKVPSNDKEALQSSLLGLIEKANCTRFFQFIQEFNIKDSKTHKGNDVNAPFSVLAKNFNFEENTIDFIGHAIAHEINDEFLELPAINTIQKIQLYMESVGKYGETPYIYPIYGLSEIVEGFSRLSAIHGGVIMLDRNPDEILFDDTGKFIGIKSNNEVLLNINLDI